MQVWIRDEHSFDLQPIRGALVRKVLSKIALGVLARKITAFFRRNVRWMTKGIVSDKCTLEFQENSTSCAGKTYCFVICGANLEHTVLRFDDLRGVILVENMNGD